MPHKVTKQSIRNKADKTLQEYIRASRGRELCELCGERQITTGHHFVFKSQSLALRFVLENIIGLCQNCHYLIHQQPSIQNAKICFKRGEAWFNNLIELKRDGLGIKFTKQWAETNLKMMEYWLMEASKRRLDQKGCGR